MKMVSNDQIWGLFINTTESPWSSPQEYWRTMITDEELGNNYRLTCEISTVSTTGLRKEIIKNSLKVKDLLNHIYGLPWWLSW